MMNKKNILACLSLLTVSFAHAQDVQPADAVDMPESMLISQEQLMKDYTNTSNLTAGQGELSALSYDDSLLVSRLSRIPTTIEMPLNNVTREFIDTYCNKMKEAVAIMLGSSNFYNPIFEEALERYGLPLELKYLPVIESALRPTATSKAGAAGLWQFMITTGKRYGLEVNTLVDERRDPVKSSDAAARYLRDLYDMFGDWSLAIAAYNCGEGTIQKAILRTTEKDSVDFWKVYGNLPRETRGYVPGFIAATYIMNYYCDHGIVPHEATLPDETDTVVVQKEVSFAQIASMCNVTLDGLRAINPQYRRDIVPIGHALRLPTAAIEDFIQKGDSIYALNPANGMLTSNVRRAVTPDVSTAASSAKSTSARYVTVRSGDTLSGIAKRNGTTVAKIKRLNGMRSDSIRPKQRLRVR